LPSLRFQIRTQPAFAKLDVNKIDASTSRTPRVILQTDQSHRAGLCQQAEPHRGDCYQAEAMGDPPEKSREMDIRVTASNLADPKGSVSGTRVAHARLNLISAGRLVGERMIKEE
jgi:hypothetical protein